jgi:hypothetical protein
MEVELPVDITDPNRIEFFWGFAHRYVGAVYCRCGKWHQDRPAECVTRIFVSAAGSSTCSAKSAMPSCSGEDVVAATGIEPVPLVR